MMLLKVPVHFTARRWRELDNLQPFQRRLGGKGFCGHLPLQIEPSQNMFDAVGRSSSHLAGVFAEQGQALVFRVDFRWQDDLADAANGLAESQSVLVDPEQFRKGMSIAAIGFYLRFFCWLDEDGLNAAVLGQQFQEPVIEAADFDDRNVTGRGLVFERLLVQFDEELWLDNATLGVKYRVSGIHALAGGSCFNTDLHFA